MYVTNINSGIGHIKTLKGEYHNVVYIIASTIKRSKIEVSSEIYRSHFAVIRSAFVGANFSLKTLLLLQFSSDFDQTWYI